MHIFVEGSGYMGLGLCGCDDRKVAAKTVLVQDLSGPQERHSIEHACASDQGIGVFVGWWQAGLP